MKKIFVFALCILTLSCSQNMKDNCTGWDYPVKPGMEEWKQFQTNDEKVQACLIPEDILSCLSTEELTDICLQYPPLLNPWAFNFLDDGLDQLFADFNGLRELYTRNDAADYLIRRYMEFIQFISSPEGKEPPINVAGLDAMLRPVEQDKGKVPARFQMSISALDALLSRIEQEESLKEILRTLVTGYETISALDYDKRYSLQYNYFARGHIIIKMNEQYQNEIHFSAFGPDSESRNIIDNLSYQLIK